MSAGYKLAIVVPRFGPDVNGGAEALARLYAAKLTAFAEVTVLTTCARDYRTWADHYAPGEETSNGVRVIRFPVPTPRDDHSFDRLSADVLTRSTSRQEQLEWMDAQGPVSPGLERYLRENGYSFDAVLFIPYLYATTFRGMPLVEDNAVLIPALHDEPPLRLAIFDEVVPRARSLIFSTPEERDLARRRFGTPADRGHLVGAGIDVPEPADPSAFAKARGITRPYVLSLGRIDPSKGSGDLLAMHREYRATRPNGVDLVMLGRSVMDMPDEPWLHAPGFVGEDEKQQALAGCVALVSASPFESLSLALLEAWAQGRPAIVTARSDVLVAQARRAGGGLWFDSADEYAAAVDLLAGRPALAWGMGRSGWRFARSMDWAAVMDRLLDALPGFRTSSNGGSS